MAADSRNHYELLGVPPNATPQEIKQAYRNLARQYHPDMRPDDTAAEELFKQINAAYQILSDPLQRARYDRQERTRWGVPNAYGMTGTTPTVHPPNKIPVKLLFFAIGFVLVMSMVMTVVLVAFTPTPKPPKTVEQFDRELTETVVARRIAAIERMPTHTPAPEYLRQAWVRIPDVVPTPEYALPVIECTFDLGGRAPKPNDCAPSVVTEGSNGGQVRLNITLNGYRRVQFEVRLAEQGPFDFAIQASREDGATHVGVFGDNRLTILMNPPLPETDASDPTVTAGQTLLIEIADQRVAWWIENAGEEILSRYLFAWGRGTDNGNQNESADLYAIFNSGVEQVTIRLYSPVLIRSTASQTPVSP